MNYYFEIIDRNKNIHYYSEIIKEKHHNPNFKLSIQAHRIWVDDGQVIKFHKNRFYFTDTTVVDMEEFVWVKLKSQLYNPAIHFHLHM